MYDCVNVPGYCDKVILECTISGTVDLDFDVIVLSEIWTTNVEFYGNILPGYDFHYDLPDDSRVEGVGIYVKNVHKQREMLQFKLPNTQSARVENMWLEISNDKNKYIIGGIYRHPNQKISEFTDLLDKTLSQLSSQKLPRIIAGDINIDLSKCSVNSDTASYVNNLLLNNFMPTIIMPTRITYNTASIIDHMYYCQGNTRSENKLKTIKSGNILSNISDHLPNYTLIINKSREKATRPLVRIFSHKNNEQFLNTLNTLNWNEVVYKEMDVDAAYSNFIKVV